MRLVLSLAAVAALAGLALAGLPRIGHPATARGEASTPGTVTVTGHGVVAVVPDEAIVTAGVHTEAASAADALAENSRLMNRVVDAVKHANGKGLQTQQVSLYPRTNESGDVVGYVADDSVSAKTKIVDAGRLIDAAVAAGANTVSGPSLDVSDRDAQYHDALRKAMADARAKAQALADAGGFGVGPVASVTESVADVPRPIYERAAPMAATSTPVEAGTQDVTADVTVSFTVR